MANDEERDTWPAPPPTEPENPKPTAHAWCPPAAGPCRECDQYPGIREQFAPCECGGTASQHSFLCTAGKGQP